MQKAHEPTIRGLFHARERCDRRGILVVNSPISQTSLNLFQAQMDTVRKAGLKSIVRFAYNDANHPTDATPAMVNTHLTQLAPYLAANKDMPA
jgi:hypothetical protein